MNLLDLVILAGLALGVVGGFRVGLVARLASWAGWIFGLIVAAGIAPRVLAGMEQVDTQVRVMLVIGLFLMIASLGAAVGELIGHRLHSLLPPIGGLRTADHVGGGIAGALGVLVVLWLLLPALSDVPGSLSRLTRNSTIARAVAAAAPRAPGPLQELRQQVADANFPEVFSSLRPSPSTGDPPEPSVLGEAVRSRVAAATVRVFGPACGRVLTGSGFAAGTDIVVTNAHVVAGVDEPRVERPDGRRLDATVLVFDASSDLAVLRVPGLGQTPLEVGEGAEGTEGAVFGHPGGQQAIEVSPARVDSEVSAVGRDLYGRSSSRRDVYVLAADLEPGDSGGAFVNAQGQVVGVAFAIAPDRPGTAYALADSELAEVLARPRTVSVDTGPCLR